MTSLLFYFSGTPEGRNIRSTPSFPVEHIPNLPPVDQFDSALSYISANSVNSRALVMTPDSSVAKEFSDALLSSSVIGANTGVDDLELIFANQDNSSMIIVSDDSCTRGFNLNLDKVFDFSLVSTPTGTRAITLAEKTQRSMRVGRLSAGSYHFNCPREYSLNSVSQHDIFRNNVARALFKLPLVDCEIGLEVKDLSQLVLSEFEPYIKQTHLVTTSRRTTPSSADSRRSSKSSIVSADKFPSWVSWAAGMTSKSSSLSPGTSVQKSKGKYLFSKPMSAPKADVKDVVISPVNHLVKASDKFGTKPVSVPKSLPFRQRRPDPVDLSLYDKPLDWPSALADCYESGSLLPLVIPKQGWRYSVTGSGGVDHIQKLVGVIEDGPKYNKVEFECVSRSWNILVSRQSFSFASGRDAWNDKDLLVFCLEYYSNYINISD